MIEGHPKDYEGESNARTLHEAHAIRKDKKKHANALKHLKKMSKTSSHAGHTHKHEAAQHDLIHGHSGAPDNAAGAAGHEEAEPIENEHVGD